jgi:hypothetical protein
MARLRRSEIARRQHRRRQLFAAGDGGSTAPQFPDAPTVSILLNNGALLDISTDVRSSAGLTVRRGRAANDTRVRAGNATMQINNLDGKYSPRNATSPLYGLIGRGTQVIITRHGARRFWGEVPEWPSEWTTGGQDAWVNLVIAGPLRRLLAPNAPVLQSALTRSAIAANPAVLWTLEEGSGATAAVAYNTTQPSLLPTGSVLFGGFSDLGGATTAVSLASAGAYLSGSPPTITGSWGFEFAVKALRSGFNRIIQITDTNGNTYGLFPPDGTTFPMQVEIGGPTTITDTTATYDFGSPAATGFDDVWHYYGVYFQQHGANITASLYVDGVLRGSGDSTGGVTLGSPTFFQISQNDVILPNDGTVHGVSHIQFFGATAQSNVYKALTGYVGETAGRRIQRLLGENSIGFVATGDLDDTMPMGAQASERLIDLIYDCETADNGFLGEDRNSFSLTYATNASMLNQPAALQLNYADSGNVALPLRPSDNDQRIVNDSDVVLTSGAGHYRYALTSGPMSTASPAAGGIGPYPENPTVNVSTVANAADVANTVTNHGLLALGGAMVAVDISDRISIDNPPLWTQADQINLVMVGEFEAFDQFRYTIAYDTVQQEPLQVGILDDPVLGVLESDGTTVVDPHTSSETLFQGLSATGELWATTALLPGDFPFDITVAGERMTVTDITGVSNPQTWTVVRSVNGVVKAIPAGAAIYVRNPFRLAQ